MIYNLALLPQKEKDQLFIDLIAARIAFKERYHMIVNDDIAKNKYYNNNINIESDVLKKRITFYRKISSNLTCLPYQGKQHK